MKFLSVVLALYLITVLNEKNRVEAFSFYDLFKLPLGYLTEKLFNWNPFKTQIKENNYFKTQLDEFSLIDPNNDYINGTIERKHFPYGCNCTNYICNCCAYIEINKLNLNDTGCLNFAYTVENFTLELDYEIKNKAFYNNSITIFKAPEMCFSTEASNQISNLCLKFYKMDARNKSLSGCVDLVVRSDDLALELLKVKLGCFRARNGTKYTEKNLMSVYFNKKKLFYSYNNFTEEFNKNTAGIGSTLFKKFNKLDLPNLAFSFSPDKLVDNLYDSFFSQKTTSYA